jgi:uncharacterized membrane protein
MIPKPQIKIQPTKVDLILESISFFFIIIFTAFSFYSFFTLPNTIAIHFNTNGEPDGYGSKYFVLLLLAIGISIYALLTFIIKKPHLYNYSIKITEENVKQQYSYATKMLRIMKLAVTLIFLSLAIGTYTTSLKLTNGIGNKSLLFTTLIVGVILASYLYKSTKKK